MVITARTWIATDRGTDRFHRLTDKVMEGKASVSESSQNRVLAELTFESMTEGDLIRTFGGNVLTTLKFLRDGHYIKEGDWRE